MEVVWADLNSINEVDGRYWISQTNAERFMLSDGMKIKIVDGDEVWDAVVHSTNSGKSSDLWSVELIGDAELLGETEYKWLNIGISNGICTGEDLVVRSAAQRMIALGYDIDEIDRILILNEEQKRRCRIIMKQMDEISKYLCLLLRHQPEKAELDMDEHGWVQVDQLINGVKCHSRYDIDRTMLENIVSADKKGRYRFDEEHNMIKCCQGHSILWVEPELEYCEPPEFLYHGTNTKALEAIEDSGAIKKMKRHAVHMQADINKAWQSAERWHQTPVVLKIDARKMSDDGYKFGVTENEVWCTEEVPVKYICDRIYDR
jgi:putative RNA 2'-phosphotransferase